MPNTLDTLFEEELALTRAEKADPENCLAVLRMAGCREGGAENVVAALAVGDGANIAAAGRMMVAECRPVAVVLRLPSWSAQLPKGKDLSDYGVRQVRDLPPEMIRDTLVLIGEDENGARKLALFVYVMDDEAWREEPGGEQTWSRFDRLFPAGGRAGRRS